MAPEGLSANDPKRTLLSQRAAFKFCWSSPEGACNDASSSRFFGGAAVWPLAARAQQPGKLPIIGYMGQGTPAAEAKRVAAFVGRLRELSWIEGRTVAIEYRWTEGRSDLAADIAAEFARRKVDIIVTVGNTANHSPQSR